MEVVMGSSSPYFKLVSSRDKPSLMDDLLAKALMRSPLHHCRNNKRNKDVVLKLSLSFSSTRRGLRPIPLSSSHTQAEVEKHELQLEESLDEYTNEEAAEPQTIRVKFQLRRECSFGQNFLIVGDDPMFGLWDPNNAIPLTWSDGHVWTVDLDIPVGKCIKFKFIMQESNGQFMWQPGPDRVLEFWDTDMTITLCEDWENPDSRRIIECDPNLNQVEEESSIEPKGYAINLNEVLVSDEGVPVLVPGLSPLPKTDTNQQGSVNEAPKDEPESVNGVAMVAHELKLPELDSKGDVNTSNLNERTKISSIDESQETTEQDDQITQPTNSMKSLFVNDFQWGKNILQKLLNGLGIQ